MTESTLTPPEATLEPDASDNLPAAETKPIPEAKAPTTGRINRNVVLGGFVVFSILLLLGWGLVNRNRSRPEPGQTAPGFEVQFFNGYDWEGRASATLEDMKGQVVVLNFWASWCVECRVEADLLEDTWRAYKDDGVLFLGVAYVDVEPRSKEYLEEFNITYPNGPDLETAISRDYRVTGVPETFFIDKNGVVRHVVIGPVSPQQMRMYLQELLAEGA
jgi:cytochrome c biogenesis protein CcmG/thiol:disulfide interchange protein DsbE